MPIRMTENIPPAPSGVAKTSVHIGEIIAEFSFDLELDSNSAGPAETPIESSDFTRVGRIVRELIPIEIQNKESESHLLNVEVELPTANIRNVTETTPDIPQPAILETAVNPAEIAPVEGAVDTVKEVPEPEKLQQSLVAEPAVARARLPERLAASESVEILSKPKTPLIAEVRSRPPEKEKWIHAKPDFEKSDNGIPRTVKPARQDLVSTTVADIVTEKVSEPRPQMNTPEIQGNIGEVGEVTSEKTQIHRPLYASTQPNQTVAIKVQAAENKVISQISSAISNTTKDTVEIRLDPPELGRVTISITQSDSSLTATVSAEKAEIGDLLRRYSELLSRELSKSGFNGVSLEFSHHDRQPDNPPFGTDEAKFAPTSPDQRDENSVIEMILHTQSGGLDIRL